MPLKTVANIGSLDAYKTLIKGDAKLVAASGVAFVSFSKFTFPDKTVSPVIFFGIIPPTCTAAVAKGGMGKATGTATINAADEIELEVAVGEVAYEALAGALVKCGVTRKLRIPLEAPKPGNGAPTPKVGVKPTTAPNSPTIGKRPGLQPTTKMPPVPTTPGNTPTPGNNPTTSPNVQNPRPLPQAPKQPTSGTTTAPLRNPVLPIKKPTPTNAPQQTPTTGPKPTTPPPQNRPPMSPKTTPTGPRPTGPMGPNPGAQTGDKTPNNKPLQKPLSTEEKAFRTQFASLKPRYDIALSQNPTNKGLQSTFAGMLQTAKKGDFKGALLDAGKLELEIAKINRTKSKADYQKNKSAKQEKRAARLAESFDAVKKSYFTPGSADRIAKEKLDAGTHFKAFLKAQKAFETARDEQTLQALEDAAKAYAKHYQDDFNAKDQQKSVNVRKLSICDTALKAARHYRLALENDKLGKPPWDEKTEMLAAEMYTKLIFEQESGVPQVDENGDPLPQQHKIATPNKSSGINGAFWIEKNTWDEDDVSSVKKTFIFKPLDSEQEVPGYPKGGSVARERLGKEVSDQLQAQMGLNFEVPETTVVGVDKDKLPRRTNAFGKTVASEDTRVGSIQHFKKSRGELKDLIEKDPSILDSLPQEEVEKMAVLDLVQLNTDRHSGNFMVGDQDDGKGGQKPRLVAIDNGLSLPSIDGLRARRSKLGAPHAVLGMTPGAQKKMSPDMVARIQAINPDEVVEGMKKSFKALQELHPDAANASQVTAANFELTKRSIQFLQKASTELSIAEIQDAYVSSLEEIFDSPPDKMEQGFTRAIQNAKDRKAGLKELAAFDGRMKELQEDLNSLGWRMSDQAFEGWALMNPAKVMKIYRDRTVNPATAKKVAELRKALKDHPDAGKKSPKGLGEDLYTLGNLLTGQKKQQAKANGDTNTAAAVDRAELFEQFGGAKKLAELDPEGKAQTPEDKVNLMLKEPIKALGGEDRAKIIAKLYPKTPVKTPLEQYQALKAWDEYQALGGDAAYSRAGGNGEILVLGIRLDDLKSMAEINGV